MMVLWSRLSGRHRCHFSTTKDASSATDAIKRFLQIKGPDSKSFLQGLCTNDITKLKGRGDFLNAVFLNTKGRIIADSIVHAISTSESPSTDLLLEIPSSVFPDLSKHLSMYKLRSKIQMTEINDSKSLLPQSNIDDSREGKYKYRRY
jgi:folate-binding Fe-S cluster repair protein YgfZ